MNHQSAVSETGAYLALVTSGSVAVALTLPRNGAAPLLSATVPVAVLLALTPGQTALAAQLVGEGGVLPAAGMSAVAMLLLVRARVWSPSTGVPGADTRLEHSRLLDPSGFPR